MGRQHNVADVGNLIWPVTQYQLIYFNTGTLEGLLKYPLLDPLHKRTFLSKVL